MVKRWQVERMALCFLSSSHKQTGENLELSPSFPRGSVNNYHCRDRREKTLDEVFEGSWLKLFTHFPVLPAMSALSSRATRLGFSFLEPLPHSRALPAVPWPFCSARCPWAPGLGSPSRLSHAPFPLQQPCGVGKAFPVLEGAGDVPELAEHRLCGGRGAPAPPAELFPGLQGFPASEGFSTAERLCRGSEPFPGAYSILV